MLKKALGVGKEDGAEQNGHSNGLSENGSHKDDGEQEGAMETQEEDAAKSPSGPRGKARRSKADAEPKSMSHGYIAFYLYSIVSTLYRTIVCLMAF